MSSVYVRDTVTDFIKTQVTEHVVDLSGRFEELSDIVFEEGLGTDDPWVGVEFVGNDEQPITIGANNVQGKYRESGAVHVHVVGIAGLGKTRDVLVRADTLRAKLRGQRLGRVIILSVTPANTDSGATLNLESGYFSASFFVEYETDLDL